VLALIDERVVNRLREHNLRHRDTTQESNAHG
jgi:hypothetical protein